MLSKDYIEKLQESALSIRKLIIEHTYMGKIYHFGGSLSMVEILSYIYLYRLRNTDLRKRDRDKVIVSKGHCCQTLYSIFALLGYISYEDLNTYKRLGSFLQGHPDMKRLPFIDFSSGSLGQGLSISVGMAIGYKMKQANHNIYSVLGDGETQEGQIWEAAMAAAKYKLDNIICYIDYNKLQVDGYVEDIMPIEPLKDKWKAFGWHVCEIDGHDFLQIHEANEECERVFEKPKLIIAHTVKGKGISFMECSKEWHSKDLTNNLKEMALKELGVEI